MPTFNFTSPEGQTYNVSAPDGTSQEEAWDTLQGQLSKATGGGSSDDFVQQHPYLAAVRKGAAQVGGDILGLPRSVEDAALWAGNTAHELYTGKSQRLPANPGAEAPSSNEINDWTGANKMPQSNDTGPEAVQLATRVAANPFSYVGPGGPVRSLLSTGAGVGMGMGANALAQYAGASPETAKEIGIGTSLLAPGFASKGVSAEAVENGLNVVHDAAEQGFNKVRSSGALADSNMLSRLAAAKKADLNQRGLTDTPGLASGTHSLLDEMTELPKGGVTTDISQLNAYRQAFNRLSQQKEQKSPGVFAPTPDAEAAGQVLDSFPGVMSQSIIPGTGKMPTPELMATLQEANQNWSKFRQAQAFNYAKQTGLLNMQMANSGKNANAVSQQFKKFAKPGQQAQFTPEQNAGISYITNPPVGQRLLRTFSNKGAAGGGVASTGIHGMGTLIGAHLGGPAGAVAGLGLSHGLTGLASLARNKYRQNVEKAADNLALSTLASSPAGSGAGIGQGIDPSIQALLAKRAMNAYIAGQQQ
jgi:hypothetical protein